MVKDAEERPARVPEYAGAPEGGETGALLVKDSNKPAKDAEMSAGLEKDSLENHVSSMSDCCCSLLTTARLKASSDWYWAANKQIVSQVSIK